MGMMINRRRVCGGKSLPYDAEIEYLESSGTQYIDTGIIINDSFEAIIELNYVSGNARFAKIMGMGNDLTPAYQYCTLQRNSDTKIDITNGDRSVETHVSFGQNYIHNIRISQISDNQTEYEVDGNIGYINNTITPSKRSSGNLYLFAANNALTNDGRIKQPTPVRLSKCRIYSFKFFLSGVCIANYIPVRKDNVGYMYDKVSGQLFGNSGTGNFILGPDV